jgi:fatty-acyl-CoA synthase
VTLGALLDRMAATRGGAEAVVFRDRRLTYGELRRQSERLARALLAAGVGRGDRVALLLPNRPEWLIAAFAAARLGAVTVSVSTFSTPREIAWTLEHARPRVLLSMEAFRGRPYLDAVAALCPELARAAPGEWRSERLPELRAVVSVEGRRPDGAHGWDDLLARADDVRPAALAAAQAAVTEDDIAFVLYTSGSTATPKGVMLAHGALIANGFEIGERMHLTAADRLWLAVPLFWSFGSANALPAILTHGGAFVLQESFEAGEALALLEQERCSVYYGMANMARAILEHPDRRRHALAGMRTGLTIGLPEDVGLTMEAVNARALCTSTASPRPTATARSPTPTTRWSCASPRRAGRCRACRSAWWSPAPGGRCRPARWGSCACAVTSRPATIASPNRRARPSIPRAGSSPATSACSARTVAFAFAGGSRSSSRPAAPTWRRSRWRPCS